MNIHQLHEHYWLNGGAIKSFHLDIQNNTAEIQLSVSRHINGKLLVGQINEKDLVPCIIKLTFQELIEASLFDKFPTQGYYLNFCTFGNNGAEVGMSFNVHDNSNYVYEKDNWVIKSKRMTWKEV
ncbi:MAG TPA: hypothetical protein VGQ04_15035 [Chitinophagaceae bacterium]|nr:hypothetical protein [Chitinophagaceae bacterium]